MSDTITCPSGLTGRIRGMKVREERILADRKLARRDAQIEQILAACWEETVDPGPYEFGEPPNRQAMVRHRTARGPSPPRRNPLTSWPAVRAEILPSPRPAGAEGRPKGHVLTAECVDHLQASRTISREPPLAEIGKEEIRPTNRLTYAR